MKAVLMSIRPKWCFKIFEGSKTVEIRRTAPKLQPPFKVYIYCSKGRDRLIDIIKDGDVKYGEVYHGKPVFLTLPEVGSLHLDRQHVVGQFICDRIIETSFDTIGMQIKEDALAGCATGMTVEEFNSFIGKSPAYLWHISELKRYKRPMTLKEMRFSNTSTIPSREITHPPQGWCYVDAEWKATGEPREDDPE